MTSKVSLASGRTYLAIPGPSVMPERVLRAMQRPAPNIYEGELVEVIAEVQEGLKRLAGTRHHVALYIGNGHAAWEAGFANTLSRGDRVLALVTGAFGTGWVEQAEAMGIEVQVEDFGTKSPADPARLEALLRADEARSIKAVLVTHVDTSTSLLNDIASLRGAIDAAGHDALLFADCVASMGCDPFEMDAWGVDLAVAASQKGLMTPPGLAMVWFSDKALERGKAADLRTPYWDWTDRHSPARPPHAFGGTPPTHHLYALKEALAMIFEEGREVVWERHRALSSLLWAAGEAWAQEGAFRFNVAERGHRGYSVTSMELANGDAKRLREFVEAKAGVTLGIGFGLAPFGSVEADNYFRIGHMGYVNAHQMLGVIAVVEAGMQALGIAHGRGGTQAAIAAMADYYR